MTKPIVLLASMALVLAGVSYWLGRSQGWEAVAALRAARPAEPERTAIERAVAAARSESQRRLEALEKENRDQKQTLARHMDAEAERAREPTQPAAAPGAGALEFKELSELVSASLEVLSLKRSKEPVRPTPEQFARLRALLAKVLSISARARELHRFPFFDRELFADLTASILNGALGLDADQAADLSRLAASAFEGVPEDVEALTDYERLRWRARIKERYLSGLEALLDAKQLERWKTLGPFAEEIVFSSGGELSVGIDDPTVLLQQVASDLQLTDVQAEALKPLGEQYREAARALLQKYGSSQEGLDELGRDARARLGEEFLDLQEHFEAQILPLLSTEQREARAARGPMVIKFQYGSGASGNAGQSYF